MANWSVATAPTVYGIETGLLRTLVELMILEVATAPTVYGIETHVPMHSELGLFSSSCNSTYRLRY